MWVRGSTEPQRIMDEHAFRDFAMREVRGRLVGRNNPETSQLQQALGGRIPLLIHPSATADGSFIGFE